MLKTNWHPKALLNAAAALRVDEGELKRATMAGQAHADTEAADPHAVPD